SGGVHEDGERDDVRRLLQTRSRSRIRSSCPPSSRHGKAAVGVAGSDGPPGPVVRSPPESPRLRGSRALLEQLRRQLNRPDVLPVDADFKGLLARRNLNAGTFLPGSFPLGILLAISCDCREGVSPEHHCALSLRGLLLSGKPNPVSSSSGSARSRRNRR